MLQTRKFSVDEPKRKGGEKKINSCADVFLLSSDCL